MDENLIQAYARLSVHEFALEVMMANWVADMGEQRLSGTGRERFLIRGYWVLVPARSPNDWCPIG